VKRKCIPLLGDFITGKALDDRAGIASLLECAKELQRLKHSADVYFVATTMEEVGHFGAGMTSYSLDPDIGIAIDVTFGDKYAGDRVKSECSKGVEITIGPNIHPELSEKLIKIADDYKIPYAIDVAPGPTGTDAWDIQPSREGIPTLLISIPLRYMHTSTEVISYRDVETTGRLLALFISSLESWEDIYS
jgi:endoglucanase